MPKKVTTDLMLRIAAQRKKGLTLQQIAEMFGISVGGAHRILKKLKEKA
jgi:DNA-binding IclR family transcriptional regulator